jgi:hypothetical protein
LERRADGTSEVAVGRLIPPEAQQGIRFLDDLGKRKRRAGGEAVLRGADEFERLAEAQQWSQRVEGRAGVRPR